jgi:response regulator of citrate/malate metabolism
MPGNGIAAAADISRRVPEATVVMLTASRDDASLFDALRAGASGYLLKDMDPDGWPQRCVGSSRVRQRFRVRWCCAWSRSSGAGPRRASVAAPRRPSAA